MAGTDCGFSTFAGFGNVDENIVYKKLESLGNWYRIGLKNYLITQLFSIKKKIKRAKMS